MKKSRLFWGFLKKGVFVVSAIVSPCLLFAQVLMSGGTYSQNFDSLAGSGSNNGWTNNVTLLGWYASKVSVDNTNISAGSGTSTTGGIYSFGTNGINSASDRALGSLAS
ncbi:MAG: hypothetical protein WCK57_11655, partial [Verrucomicrobiae bacterium]